MIQRRPLPDTAPIDALGPYRVLSLTGGGHRSQFTAQLLAHIEAMPEYEGTPIGQRFDIIAGTSAGGLSVGTAGVTRASSPDRLPRRGITWAKPALELGIHAQEILAQEACVKRLQDRYLHLNKRPGVEQGALRELDLATPASTGMLMTLADERFRELLSDPAQMRSLKQIVSATPCVP